MHGQRLVHCAPSAASNSVGSANLTPIPLASRVLLEALPHALSTHDFTPTRPLLLAGMGDTASLRPRFAELRDRLNALTTQINADLRGHADLVSTTADLISQGRALARSLDEDSARRAGRKLDRLAAGIDALASAVEHAVRARESADHAKWLEKWQALDQMITQLEKGVESAARGGDGLPAIPVADLADKVQDAKERLVYVPYDAQSAGGVHVWQAHIREFGREIKDLDKVRNRSENPDCPLDRLVADSSSLIDLTRCACTRRT